jgi:hypothetical protein
VKASKIFSTIGLTAATVISCFALAQPQTQTPKQPQNYLKKLDAQVQLTGSDWQMADDQYGNVSMASDGTEYKVNMDSIRIVDGITRTATIAESDTRPRLRADGSRTQQTVFKSVVVGCRGSAASHEYDVTGEIVANQQPPKLISKEFWGYGEAKIKDASYGTVQYLLAEKICAQ